MKKSGDINKEKKNMTGKVWLLGAGPGDAELLTLKGKKILERADVIVYDALVGDGIFGFFPEGALQLYVGKRGGHHAKTQEEIQEILAEQAKAGKQVVRLKGGDPFVFGRGSEEAMYLRERDIPFEIIPGVTSAVAVPAYCGIPVTHRGMASSFHVITGHFKNGEPVRLDYKSLVSIGGTLVFLMGLSNSEVICSGLLSAGMAPDTPAAFLQEGTTAGQRMVNATLSTLIEAGKREGIKPPAILIAGEVCGLSEYCQWAGKRPLSGRKILVTRPRQRAGRMAAELREAGGEVVELPAIETKLSKDREELKEIVENIKHYQWLAFTSPSGVELFFEFLSKEKIDVRCLSGIKIAVLGSATEKMLNRYGLFSSYMPGRFYALDLGEGLAEQISKEERLLILRAGEGSPKLLEPLDKAEILYEDMPLYDTVLPEKSPQTERVKELLKQKKFDFVTFTSASTVTGFMKMLIPEQEELSAFTAVCIGEETEKCAKAQGMNCIISEIPSIEKMIEVMVNEAPKR